MVLESFFEVGHVEGLELGVAFDALVDDIGCVSTGEVGLLGGFAGQGEGAVVGGVAVFGTRAVHYWVANNKINEGC